MLLSIPPEAMILGKVLSGAAAAIIQFVIWLLSIIAGFGIGTAIVKLINPDTDMFIVLFFDSLDSLSGIFSLPAILLSIVIVLLGFLMYCTLASISGAMASKQEDLSSTQSIFVLILVFSFYVSLQGFFTGDGAATAQWADYLPFTAILTVPGKLMLSEISLLEGGISIGILTLTCLLFIVCAGKIYRSLVFYKGNVPKIKDVIAIILNKQ
jgi:ABC-type Na+ efflux pump permease subunit